MTYTADATDPTKPLDSDPARKAALELRTIKAKIVEMLGTIGTNATTADTATALVQTNLNTEAVTRANADTALGNSITTLTDNTNTAIANLKANEIRAARGYILTGSGNFTVPTGVTSLQVTITSGATAGGVVSAMSGGALRAQFYAKRKAGQSYTYDVTVTSGQVIAYSCGAGQVLSIHGTGVNRTIEQDIAPGFTSFGGVSVNPPESLVAYWTAYGTIPTNVPYAINNNAMNVQEFSPCPFGSDLAVDSNTLSNGNPGSILVRW